MVSRAADCALHNNKSLKFSWNFFGAILNLTCADLLCINLHTKKKEVFLYLNIVIMGL